VSLFEQLLDPSLHQHHHSHSGNRLDFQCTNELLFLFPTLHDVVLCESSQTHVLCLRLKHARECIALPRGGCCIVCSFQFNRLSSLIFSPGALPLALGHLLHQHHHSHTVAAPIIDPTGFFFYVRARETFGLLCFYPEQKKFLTQGLNIYLAMLRYRLHNARPRLLAILVSWRGSAPC
jgi:hypothetical protein